jgi:hypothetical protein
VPLLWFAVNDALPAREEYQSPHLLENPGVSPISAKAAFQRDQDLAVLLDVR